MKVPKRRKTAGVQLNVYVTPELNKRFRAYCAAKNVSQSSVAEAAVKQYLDGLSDLALLLRRLDRLGRGTDRVHRDLSILSEAFATWVQIWYGSTPQVPDEEQDFARRQASQRYQRFVEFVARQLSSGHRFVDDLVHDKLADAAELEAATRVCETSEGEAQP